LQASREGSGRGARELAIVGSLFLACLLVVACSESDRGEPIGAESPATERADVVADRPDRPRGNAAGKPNVVVVLIDTLRPDHLGFYGYPRETAPYLAGLAERSVVFTHAVSTSTWTAPSTSSLFTGLHPLRHGVKIGIVAHRKRMKKDEVTGNLSVELNRLPESVATLPELFHDLGYRTFGVAANPNIGSSIGFDRGFDRFKLLESQPISAEEALAAGHPKKPFRWANGDELYAELRSWKAEILGGEEPFFLYFHINDVHGPYLQRAPFYRAPAAEDQGQARYDSGIGYVDDILARMHSDLKLDENTIIAVVSDHGEAFGEHGYLAHREGVYGESNRILMMISAPSLGVEADRIERRVSIMGLLPTLLDLLGATPSGDRDGLSLVPLMRRKGEGDPDGRADLEGQLDERVLIAHRIAQDPEDPAESWAVMRGRWKLILDRSRVELYDSEVDIEERHNVAGQHPEVRQSLEAALSEFRKATRQIDSERVDLQLDPETIEALRAIGYGD